MGCNSQQCRPNHRQTVDRLQRAATINNSQNYAPNCATVCNTRVPSWQGAPHRTRRLEWGAAASSAAQTIAKRVIDGNGQQRSTKGRTMHTAVPQSATQEYQAGSERPIVAAARTGCSSQQCRPNHRQTGDKMATGSHDQQQAELCTQLCDSLQHKSTKLVASAPPHAAARMGCSSQQCRPNHRQTGDRWQRAAMTSRAVRTAVPQSAPQEYQAGSERPTARGG